jgi:hypothetical protein
VVDTKKAIQENVKKALDARSCRFMKWKKNPSIHAEKGGQYKNVILCVFVGSMAYRQFASRPFKCSVSVHVVSVYKVFNGEEQVLLNLSIQCQQDLA